MIPELASMPQPWGGVRLRRPGESVRATGASVVMASAMGCALSWCCSTSLMQAELINKNRGIDKPPGMAPGGNSTDYVGCSRTSWHGDLERKKVLDWCLLILGPRKQVFAYSLEG